jgi:hypothetical protein
LVLSLRGTVVHLLLLGWWSAVAAALGTVAVGCLLVYLPFKFVCMQWRSFPTGKMLVRQFAGLMRAYDMRDVRNVGGCATNGRTSAAGTEDHPGSILGSTYLFMYFSKNAKTSMSSFAIGVVFVARSRSLVDEVVVRNRCQGKGAKLSRRGACVSCFLASECRCRIRKVTGIMRLHSVRWSR